MYDNDEADDHAVLSVVRARVCGMPLPPAPRMEAIAARGRARRRRRLGGAAVAGTAACAALAGGLTGGWGSAGTAPQAGAASPAVKLAAFSVVTNPQDGVTTLTLTPGQVADPGAVRQALAEHGIPALVTAGKFCRTAVQPAPGVGRVVSLGGLHGPVPGGLPGGPGKQQAGTVPSGPGGQPGGQADMRTSRNADKQKGGRADKQKGGPTLVIRGSAIPGGAKLSIGYRRDPRSREISFTLIQAGAPLTCATLPDHGPHGNR